MENKNFKIGKLEDTEVASDKDSKLSELNALKIEKLSSKITLITTIMGALILFISVFAYIKLENQVTSKINLSAGNIKLLENAFKSEFDTFSSENKKLSKKVDNAYAKNKKDIEDLAKSLSDLQSKINLTEISNKFNAITKQQSILEKNVSSINDEFLKLKQTNNQELNKSLNSLQNQINSLQENLNGLKNTITNANQLLEKKIETLEYGFNKEKEKTDNIASQVKTIKTESTDSINIQNKQLILQKKVDALYEKIDKIEAK